MRIKKTVLKEIVKECLIEILSEGISDVKPRINEVASRSASTTVPKTEQKRYVPSKKVLDEHKKIIDEIVSNNDVMSEMLKETLESGAYQSVPGSEEEPVVSTAIDPIQRAIFDKDLTDIFGQDMVKNWEELAFMNK